MTHASEHGPAVRIRYDDPIDRGHLEDLNMGTKHFPTPGSWAYVYRKHRLPGHATPADALRAALRAGKWEMRNNNAKSAIVELCYVVGDGADVRLRAAVCVNVVGRSSFLVTDTFPIGAYKFDNLGAFTYEVLKTVHKRLEPGASAVKVLLKRSDGRRGTVKMEVGSLKRSAPARPMRWPIDDMNLFAARYYRDWCPRGFLDDHESVFEVAGAAALRVHDALRRTARSTSI